jgi:gamma-glutamylcyclotransferase (GGCT)/AIG2-like uncharacterized protein YtfP
MRPVVFMFAYGMNTNLLCMKLRCEHARTIGVATLNDYQLDFRYHLDLTPRTFSKVTGVLWEMSISDLDRIDQAEGYPNYYRRFISLPFIRYYGNTYEAWTYTMTECHLLQKPNQLYWDLVVEGYKQNNIDTGQLYEALNREYADG